MLNYSPLFLWIVILSSLMLASSRSSQSAQQSLAEGLISQAEQIISDGERSGEAYFSADGKQLIFQSENVSGNPFYQISLLDLPSRATTLLSPGLGKTTCAWLHPNMRRALFASTHLDPQAQDKQNEELERRRKGIPRPYAWDYDPYFDIFAKDLTSGALSNLTNTWGYDAEGSYSPDGSSILFASNRHGFKDKLTPQDKEKFEKDPSFLIDLYLMNSDGSQVQRLTHNQGYDGGPFFSPDGQQITWRRFDRDGRKSEVMMAHLDVKSGTLSQVHQLTQIGKISWAPYFHPSGKYLIFSSNIEGHANFELYLISTTPGQNTIYRVTDSAGFDGLPVFSPDGKKLVWSSQRGAGGKAQVFMADWDHEQALRELGISR